MRVSGLVEVTFIYADGAGGLHHVLIEGGLLRGCALAVHSTQHEDAPEVRNALLGAEPPANDAPAVGDHLPHQRIEAAEASDLAWGIYFFSVYAAIAMEEPQAPRDPAFELLPQPSKKAPSALIERLLARFPEPVRAAALAQHQARRALGLGPHAPYPARVLVAASVERPLTLQVHLDQEPLEFRHREGAYDWRRHDPNRSTLDTSQWRPSGRVEVRGGEVQLSARGDVEAAALFARLQALAEGSLAIGDIDWELRPETAPPPSAPETTLWTPPGFA